MNDVTKLPKWAQEHIYSLEMKLKDVEKQLEMSLLNNYKNGSGNHYFIPMDSVPRDGTKVILMHSPIQYPVIASFENDKSCIGWCTDFGQDYVSDDEFCGWFPIPKIMENK